jgi:hypothetical protein
MFYNSLNRFFTYLSGPYLSLLVSHKCFDKCVSKFFSTAWISTSNELSVDFHPRSPSFRVLGILAAQLIIS